MENQNNQNNQTKNKAYIVGVLKEKKIEFKMSKTNKPMCTGKLIVEVDTELGKGEVEVKVMQMAEKSKGGENPLYKALHTINTQYKDKLSLTSDEDVADTIRIEGSLEDGTYYSARKGDFVEKVDLKAFKIERVPAETTHCCKVAFEGYISSIKPVEEELEVEIVGIGYENIAVPVKGMIPKNLVAPFQSMYMVGCTTTLNIAILNQVETTEVQETVGFGQGIGEKIERTVYKRIIFGGDVVKMQGTTGAINKEDVEKGLALRQAKLEEDKTKALASAGSNTSMTTGFNAGGQSGTPNGFGAPANFGTPTGFGNFPTA